MVWLTAAGWSCTGGVSEESRVRSQADVNLGRGLYADEHNPRAAIVAWERAARLDPENAEARLYLGIVFANDLRMYDRAETELRRAIALLEPRVATEERDRATLAEARNTLGAVLVNVGRYDDAIRVLRQATAEVTYTSQHLAWGNLGWAYQRKGDHPHAVEALQRAVSLQPAFCVGFARLAQSQFDLGQHAQALQAVEHALDPAREECTRLQLAWLIKARIHTQLQQPEQASEAISRCVALSETTDEGRACAALRH